MTLVRELAIAVDPVRLAKRLGIEPDEWQASALRSNTRRMLLNCSRQSGKSTIVAVKSLHRALYRGGSLILLVSPSLRQSQELFKKVLAFYRVLERPVPAEAENRLTLELENGSRIISLPGKEGTIRGYSAVDLLVTDEAAQVTDDLYQTVRPFLATSNGQLIAPSTPFGRRGWWYEAWSSGAKSWERYEVPATQVPRISAEFLQEEREALGEWFYRQEYECAFMEAQTSVFSSEMIDRLFDRSVTQWDLLPTAPWLGRQASSQ
jgi:hypothetical protein